MTLKAPFPWFGGKSRVADLIWSRLGADVNRYVEPFFGSGATLLARPLGPDGVPSGGEVANDYDGLLANFWRAIQADPAGVAHFADYPISEIDLGARHAWLVARKARLKWALEDPDFYDIKAAGWWVWGQSQWIGGGFCSGAGPWRHDGAQFFKAKDALDDSEIAESDVSGGGGISRRIPGCSERDRKGVHSATIAGCRSQTGNPHPSGGGSPAPDAWHHRASESGCPIRSQPLRGGISRRIPRLTARQGIQVLCDNCPDAAGRTSLQGGGWKARLRRWRTACAASWSCRAIGRASSLMA
jgi:hypothetical protein